MGGHLRLADEQRTGCLYIAPERIFIGSEVLTNASCRTIEEIWGKRLFDQHAPIKTDPIAAECAERPWLHIRRIR